MKGIGRVLGLEIILICDSGRVERVGCGLHSAGSTCEQLRLVLGQCVNLGKSVLSDVKPAVYGLNIPYHYTKFDSMQLYFMAYCIESFLQPFSE